MMPELRQCQGAHRLHVVCAFGEKEERECEGVASGVVAVTTKQTSREDGPEYEETV